jgi:photosystem II stability/assembly factor-like uncharacterized protein
MTMPRAYIRLSVGLLAALLISLLACGNDVALAAGQAAPPTEAQPPTYRWRQVNIGLEDPFAMRFSSNFATNGQVYAFFDHNTLFIGHGYGAIFRSDTRGSAWSIYSAVPPLFKLTAVSPETPAGPVLLGVESYYDPIDFTPYYRLLRSTSPGAGWTTVWAKSPLFNQIVFSPAFASDHTVFVTLADSPTGGIWKSTDGGVTWHPEQKIAVHPYNGRVISLAFSPNFVADRTMMASVPSYWDGSIAWPGGTYRSTDGGNTWFASDMGCVGRVWKLVFSPTFATDRTVYAQGEDSTDVNNYRVYRSTNGGGLWECLPSQPQAGVIFDIALSPAFASDHTVLLGTTGGGLVQSADGGASWQTLAWNGSGVQYAYFSPNYPQDHILAVALQGTRFGYSGPGGNFFSYDGGKAWRPAGIYPAPVQSMALSPAYNTDRSLWASPGAGQANAYRSTDGGDTWLTQFRYILYNPAFNSMAAFAQAGSVPLVFATSQAGAAVGGGVYLSTDGGVNYGHQVGSPLYGNLVVVSPGFASDHTVWVGAYTGLYRSTNSGTNWGLLPGDLPAKNVTGLAVSPAYAADQTLFAVVADGATAQLYRTNDSGAHWIPLPLPGGAIPIKVTLSPSFAADQAVWVSSLTHGVLRSTNQGTTWQAPTTVLAGCGDVQPGGGNAGRLLWATCSGWPNRGECRAGCGFPRWYHGLPGHRRPGHLSSRARLFRDAAAGSRTVSAERRGRDKMAEKTIPRRARGATGRAECAAYDDTWSAMRLK